MRYGQLLTGFQWSILLCDTNRFALEKVNSGCSVENGQKGHIKYCRGPVTEKVCMNIDRILIYGGNSGDGENGQIHGISKLGDKQKAIETQMFYSQIKSGIMPTDKSILFQRITSINEGNNNNTSNSQLHFYH